MGNTDTDKDEKGDEAGQDIREELGYHPAFVGSAALVGGEALERSLNPGSFLSRLLYEVTKGGKKIPEELHGMNLDSVGGASLAGFTQKERRVIARFKKEQLGSAAKKIPIIASDTSAAMPIDFDSITKNPPRELRRRIMLNRTSVPVAMHEIGHMAPIAGEGRPRLNAAYHAANPIARGMRYPLMGQVLAPPDEDSSSLRRWGYDHAPELVGAAHIPMLAEEMRATAKALSGAHRHGIGALKALGELGPAFGTYLGRGVLPPVLATIMAKQLVKHLYKKELETSEPGQEKQAGLRAMAKAFLVKRAAMEPKVQGALKNTMAVAYNSSPPQPQTTPAGSGIRKVKPISTGVTPKPPSKVKFYNDQMKSNLGFGGNRLGVSGP